MKGDGQIKVFAKATPLVVPLVEEGWLNKGETKSIVRNYLQSFKVDGVDTFILGCTHYPLLKKVIAAKLGKRVRVVDPAEEVAAEVKSYFAENPNLAGSLVKAPSEFFVTDKTEHFGNEASSWLGRSINLKKVDLT